MQTLLQNGGILTDIFTGRNEVVAKVMFLQVCVCPQGGRVSASVHAGMPYPPDQADTPPGPGRPPGTRQTPPGPGRHPPRQTPPGTRQTSPDQADPPGTRQTPPGPGPPREADSSIRSTSGRYVSYWNAFLFFLISKELHVALLSISVS